MADLGAMRHGGSKSSVILAESVNNFISYSARTVIIGTSSRRNHRVEQSPNIWMDVLRDGPAQSIHHLGPLFSLTV